MAASRSDLDTAIADYNTEANRLKEIVSALLEKINALDPTDANLEANLTPIKAEYKELTLQVNPNDAKIKQLDREMCRTANEYKTTLATDNEKIAVAKEVLDTQKIMKEVVPVSVQFKNKRTELEEIIAKGKAETDTAASSETQESSRVQSEIAKASVGTQVAQTGGAFRITNPLGDSLPDAAGAVNNIARGAAARITGGDEAGATTSVDGSGGLPEDTGVIDVKAFSLSKPPGGPPYENVLEQFASYSPIWTMAALTPTQFNDPSTYRGKPGALKNVIFSSGGRFDSERTKLFNSGAQPEYYVNNFEFFTTAGASPGAGTSNVQTFSFDLYEPYSMGLFLQSCVAAAIESGYTSYNECPFLLKLEFVGHQQDGSILKSSEFLAKYFVLQLQDVNFTVTEAGSQYKIKAHPYNHNGFSNVVSILQNDVVLKVDGNPGEDTSKLIYLLSKGTNSLVAALNKIQENLAAGQTPQQRLPDEYSIVFPTNWTDPVGLSPQQREDAGFAMFQVVNDDEGDPIPGLPPVSSTEYGDGEIGQAQLGFDANSGGNFNFGLAQDVVDPATGVIKRDALTIDPKQRTFTFAQKTPITQIIAQLILSSEYAKRALDEKNLDEAGMIKWFRIDCQIQLGQFDDIRNMRQRKYVYRVMPYLVHNSVFSNSSAAPPGYDKLKEVCAKEYDYFYTGQNNSVIKFDIQINSLFHHMKTITPPSQNANVANQDVNTPTDGNVEDAPAADGNNASAQGTISASPTKSSFEATKDPVKGGHGTKDVGQIVATAMHNAILASGSQAGDLMRINMEIIGDPYYLVDQGMGNYLGEGYGGPFTQQTADQTMNYQGTDSYFNVVFRTPLEPNLGVKGAGGLYQFPNKGAQSPLSGLYKVVKITNKFSDGVFRQVIEANRMPKQPADFPDNYTPTFQNTFIYSQPKELPSQGNVVDPSANSSLDLRTEEEIAYAQSLGDFEG